MSDVSTDPMPPGPSRSRIRLPHWGWFLLATVILVVSYVGFSIWIPWHREQKIIQMIESWGGYAQTETVGPEWLSELVGEDRMKKCELFERVVTVGDAKISDSDLVHLNGLKNLDMLILCCSGSVTDASLPHLSKMTSLHVLHLGETAVTDAGLTHLNGFTILTSLYLNGTAVTDAGLSHLSGLKKLQLLDLDDTKVTDAGLTHLSGLKNLETLFLKNTAVTSTGIEELQKALPDCNIHY